MEDPSVKGSLCCCDVRVVGGLPYKKFAKILSSQIKIKFIMFLMSSTICFIAGRSHYDFYVR